nr:RNA-directed DNA polymerase, eukaryota, reverse transcriptase zinc-binding domain protein [Tanacetum cinerariifolium]
AISVNGVFEIDMNNNVSKNNNNSIFSINKKRKLDLNSSYLWHCRLAHIGKTRMQNLHSEEVELQLGKKIKALRSDRGGEYLSQEFKDYLSGEYLSQEFKDYLSENGTVQNLTSPYTPQQNGVSKRRNRTLLDMMRSMFNLTTLQLSFWDYALKFVVRILNMVPTKKVDKTPYEIWHGKAPNSSYLNVWGCEAYVKRDSADKLQQRSVKYGDFLERDLISQKFSGSDYDLEDDHMDTLPSKNTSEIPVEPESLGPPSELIPVYGDISYQKIKRVVWDCGIDKSPGPDGVTFGFIRRYWYLIEKDVVAAVQHFFTFGNFPKGCNASFIALIPKIPDAKLVKDFRPIYLIGSLYKIIVKILANRLVGVLEDLVSEVQSAFVADRQILDGDVLNRFGFGAKRCGWIQECLRSSHGSVLVNGSPTEEFQFYKGLKQGDPLSPFLFIFVMESLHLSFKRVDDAVSIKKVEEVTRHIGCGILNTPFSFLGSKVGGCMSRIKSWDEVIDKMVNHLSKSKMKTLSIGGRLTFLKAVFGSMPIYRMSIFKEKEGLGVSSLFVLNRALMFKWVWQFFNQSDLLWVRVIHTIHGVDGRIGRARNVRYTSICCDIIKEMDRMPRSSIESEQWDHLLDSLDGVLLNPSEDRWSWDLNGSGEFLVASARRYIDNNRLPDISSKTRWIKEVPIKVNVHAWKVHINSLPTQWNISRRVLLEIFFEGFAFGVCYGLWWFIWAFRNKKIFGVVPSFKITESQADKEAVISYHISLIQESPSISTPRKPMTNDDVAKRIKDCKNDEDLVRVINEIREGDLGIFGDGEVAIVGDLFDGIGVCGIPCRRANVEYAGLVIELYVGRYEVKPLVKELKTFWKKARVKTLDVAIDTEFLQAAGPTKDDMEGMFEMANEELFPACTWMSSLYFLPKFAYLKILHKWTDTSFDETMEFLLKAFPAGAKLPKSYYEAKKSMKKAWKEFDKNNPKFAKEHRNVQLGLAANGFNPFENLSQSYGMWLVILTTYNTPPWICMKKSSFMLTCLTLGPKSPSKDMDVYWQPLVKELKTFWKKARVKTLDVAIDTEFLRMG